MWNKFVVGAFVCLVLPCVLTAPVEDTGGQKQAPKFKMEKQLTQDQDGQKDLKTSVNNDDQRIPTNRDSTEEKLGQAMDDLTAEDIIRDVLITIRDHPIIMKELLEDKEKELDKALETREEGTDERMFEGDDDQAFQQPPPQLAQMPKTVQKKGDYNWRKHLDSSSSESSSKDVPYRYRYRDSSESVESESSSESKSSSKQSSSKESNDDSNELTGTKRKRVPEIPEQTIDLTSFPQAGNNKRNNLRQRVYKALGNQGHIKNPRTEVNPMLGNDPFINPLPLLTKDDIHTMDNDKIPKQSKSKMGILKQKTNSSQGIAAPVKVKMLRPLPLHEWNGFPVAKDTNKDENELAALSSSKAEA